MSRSFSFGTAETKKQNPCAISALVSGFRWYTVDFFHTFFQHLCSTFCRHFFIGLPGSFTSCKQATPIDPKQALRGEKLWEDMFRIHCVPSDAPIAAAAAGRAWLERLWKSESSQKGIVLYQMMVKMLKGRSFPMVLVQEILMFIMQFPKIIDQLDLWANVGDWMAILVAMCLLTLLETRKVCGVPPFRQMGKTCISLDSFWAPQLRTSSKQLGS